MEKEKVKVIAFYLPQFHSIPENNEWWGKDFTEWVNVRNAKPLFYGHDQPKVPLDKNYYDLLDDDVKIWQAEIAKKYGVYGFCYYHYWFNGKMLLEKPMEQMLQNKKIDIHFCISWANATWTKEWVGDSKKVLIPQTYGGEKDWDDHYQYLRDFFADNRYIKIDNRPLFIIYDPIDMNDCAKLMDRWNELAKRDGFNGVCFAYQLMGLDLAKDPLREKFDYDIEFQPSYGLYEYERKHQNSLKKYLRKIKWYIIRKHGNTISKIFHVNLSSVNVQKKVRIIDYRELSKIITDAEPVTPKSIPGAFARWDNTPRKKERGIVYINGSAEEFKRMMIQQVKKARSEYKTDMVFVYAWNEWAEGGFLEPDEKDGYAYLTAIKEAVSNE